MSEVKITDLVSEEAINQLKEANKEIWALLDVYQDTAKAIAAGLEIKVNVTGDIDKLERLLIEKTKEAAVTTERLTQAVQRQGQAIANTTNTISRELMEQERINKATREQYTDTEKFKALLEQVNGSYEARVKRLVELEGEIKKAKDVEKALDDKLKEGKISQQEYVEQMTKVKAESRALAVQKSELTNLMKNEEKEMQSVEGSYKNLSQRLELMKKAYKDLTEEERESDLGKQMETAIQDLDAHLKDMAADMGEFQRNVGNYAIAGQNGVVATESLMEALTREAVTMQDVADQTKILEEAKRMLDTSDEHYAETLDAINDKIDENKARLSDVSDIMDRQATTAAEAEAQNKRLEEAMKHVDLSADDAQEQIDKLNEKIEENKELIDRATPTADRLAESYKEFEKAAKEAEKAQEKLNKEMEQEEKKSETLAGQVLSLIGVNENFASSLTSLESQGNVWQGLGTKVKAFGKTLTGLLANPWVLAFLGIAGVVAGVKWWYDYNKGLERASLMTKNFTNLVGDDMREIRTQTQTLAETMGESFDDTIGAANTLAQQFGESWEDTMELMKDGVVLGANLHGNMIENIDKYAGAFHDAGISAQEFMAVLVNTKDGLFDEKAMKGITDAGMRIRNMSAKAQKALEDIGISGKKMQDDLEAGNITMLEAIQQVTDKLQELPPNAQEVGSVMVNVFGKKSAMAGEEVIKSISDIETSLGKMKGEMSEVQKINEQQIEAQNELNATIAAMFDMTGGGFEKMTKSAKLYITQGLTAIIKGVVDVINWFIRLYNKSMIIRAAANMIANSYKAMWETVKLIFRQIVDSFKAFGTVIEGVFTLDWDKIQNGYAEGLKALGKNVSTWATTLAKNTATAFNNTLSDEIKEIDPKLHTTDAVSRKVGDGGGDTHSAEGTGWDPNADKKAEKARKEAEKAAKEELKRLQELEESKIAMMAEGHEKELALIRFNFRKKLDQIQGEGATQTALRLQLAAQCEKEVAECERKYQEELAKINLENALAAVKKGSEEELRLRLAQLEKSRQTEIKEAEKTGADVNMINLKFEREREEMENDFAEKRAAKIEERYATQQIKRDKEISDSVNALKERYAKEMALAKDNAAKQEDLKWQLENDLFRLQKDYAEKSGEAVIKMIEEILRLENMSTEDRLKWETELAKAKIALADQVADANAESVERQIADDDRLREKRMSNLERWLNVAAEAVDNISELVATLYDGQISKIEEEEERNQEAADKEQERISDLVSKKVITEEEGEARKRAAEEQTARKEKELAKKKADLQYRQAIWDKANSVAQTGISTALALMRLWVEPGWPQAIPLAAVVGAMGALQLATILATPIPKYRTGTDFHKGGPAIVGDGGRQEVVMFRGSAWLTPDTPTLVEIPKGASVIPSTEEYAARWVRETVALPLPTLPDKGAVPVVVNDYSRLESEVRAVGNLIRQQTKMQRRISWMERFELFKKGI